VKYVLLLALCGFVGVARADPAPPKADGGAIRLVYSPFGTQSFPPYVIKRFSLDKKYGFELQGIPTANAQANNNAVQAHGTEIALFGWNEIGLFIHAGVKIVGIAPFLTWANTVMVPIDSPIKTIGDLKGKRVGIYRRANIDWVVMRTLTITRYGFDLEKAATIQEGAVPLLYGLMQQNQLDATQMYNSFTPEMVATGKFRVLATNRGMIEDLGLPAAPFLIYTADSAYATAHPDNVRAFLAAYRDAIEILKTNDQVWIDHGHEMKLDNPQVVALFRDEVRADVISRFDEHTEADIRKTFDVLLAAAGAEVMGMSTLPEGFMTAEYQ
jgi:ABC-type nitrate/sulfonate/bicarbonate transport system substrate-binding protein